MTHVSNSEICICIHDKLHFIVGSPSEMGFDGKIILHLRSKFIPCRTLIIIIYQQIYHKLYVNKHG